MALQKEFIKGNEAAVKAAILAGCRVYFGYPITPASEVAHAAAFYMPLVGGTFIQAESEVAAINMVYGAAGAGARALTGSSGPGISLKQEGLSYMAGSELPCVVIDVMRAGPGLGNIWPEQSDYNQVVKGGGHGNYKNIVLAPNSAQEMADHTYLAFDLADKWRNAVIVLSDAYVGQMMEQVEFPQEIKKSPYKDWALYADAKSKKNLLTSIYMNIKIQEAHNIKLQKKYKEIEEKEVRFENYQTDDAQVIFVAYGIVSRVVMSAIDEVRKAGKKVGMIRPITLWPFPTKEMERLAAKAKFFVVAECSNGQLIDDVKLSICCKKEVRLYNRMGGEVPSVKELVNYIKEKC